eukprot:9470151-Pyramimonas_sp.AAC.1
MSRPNPTINPMPMKIGNKQDMVKDKDGRYVFPLLRDPADYEPCESCRSHPHPGGFKLVVCGVRVA